MTIARRFTGQDKLIQCALTIEQTAARDDAIVALARALPVAHVGALAYLCRQVARVRGRR